MILLIAMLSNHHYALWICSWYPNQLEPLSGDFIQRHAAALATKMPVHVLAIIVDEKAIITSDIWVEHDQKNGVRETIVYVHIPAKKPIMWRKWKQWKAMLRQMKKHAGLIKHEFGKPLLIHAHVAIYAGLLAHRLSAKWRVPFFISEHWTEYLPEATPNFRKANPWLKWQWKKAMQAAQSRSAVSYYLADVLQTLSGLPVVRIPNVVNHRIFSPKPTIQKLPQLLHVSTLSAQKQPQKMLDAWKAVTQHFPAAKLLIIGPKQNWLQHYAQSLGIDSSIQWLPETTQEQLALYMAASQALVLYSAYETFGCVVIEAMAAGLPVIASNIPPMKELLQHRQGHWLVDATQTTALSDAMIAALGNATRENGEVSPDTDTSEFSYENVGAKFIAFYGLTIAE